MLHSTDTTCICFGRHYSLWAYMAGYVEDIISFWERLKNSHDNSELSLLDLQNIEGPDPQSFGQLLQHGFGSVDPKWICVTMKLACRNMSPTINIKKSEKVQNNIFYVFTDIEILCTAMN